MKPAKHIQNRDKRDGRYTFDGKWDRLCVCGHELGVHYGAAPHECDNLNRVHSMGEKHPQAFRVQAKSCDCQKFRPSRKKAGLHA